MRWTFMKAHGFVSVLLAWSCGSVCAAALALGAVGCSNGSGGKDSAAAADAPGGASGTGGATGKGGAIGGAGGSANDAGTGVPTVDGGTTSSAVLLSCGSLGSAGALHWVSSTGTAAWTTCVGRTALADSAACRSG